MLDFTFCARDTECAHLNFLYIRHTFIDRAGVLSVAICQAVNGNIFAKLIDTCKKGKYHKRVTFE